MKYNEEEDLNFFAKLVTSLVVMALIIGFVLFILFMLGVVKF